MASGINVLVSLLRPWIRCRDRKVDCFADFRLRFGLDAFQNLWRRQLLFGNPRRQQLQRVAPTLPLLLFLPGAVVFAVDIAYVMAMIAVGVAQQKYGSFSRTRAFHQRQGGGVDCAHVLSVDAFGMQAEGNASGQDIARRGLREMGVFVVEIVFADVDHRELPQLGEVEFLIDQALSQRSLAEKADGHPAGAQSSGGKRRARGDAHAAGHDGIGSQIPGGGIGDVHGPAFAATVAGFLAQQFGEHAVGRRALGQAMPMTAMGAGDVIARTQGFADADGHRFFADVEMCQTWHQCARVEIVDLFLKQADADHLPVHAQGFFDGNGVRGSSFDGSSHFFTPAMLARTSKTTAKSCLAQPIPRAAVRNSLLTAVLGKGTSSWRPISRASSRSFCIMFTSNQASSGCWRTNGPRYWIMGEAMALCVRMSTAVSRLIPLFSASSTPSEKANICTARLRLVAIFMESASPLSPTWVTLGPMSSSRGLRRSKVSFRPPTMTDSFPSCKVTTLPETGASTMSAPLARTLAASARLTAGLTVLISTNVLPGPRAETSPSGPSATASRAAALVTMAKTTSAAAVTARGESAQRMPLSISHCAFLRVRLKPVTVWPLASSRLTI